MASTTRQLHSASARATPPPAAAGDDARERMVAAARARFFRYGFARCTMDELAAELGMSKKTLYQHFRSKDALVDELITRKSAAMIAGIEEILALPGVTFAERAGRFIQHVLGQLSEVSVPFLHDVRRFTPKVHARIEGIRVQHLPRFWERLLTLGIEARAVRADIDVPFVARLLLVTMHHLLQPEALERLQAPPHVVMGRFFNLLFSGLLTEAGHDDYDKHRAAFEQPLPMR